MTGFLRRLVFLMVLLLPALALAGRVFQWTDEKGVVHLTDNLWELPEQVREKYLALIEEEARKKYTPQQIRTLKEGGNWPPMDLIRPPVLKEMGPLTEWMGFQIVGTDVETYRKLNDEYRFQWSSFHAEQARLRSALPVALAAVTQAEEAVLKSRLEDTVNGRVGDAAETPKAQKVLDAALKAVAELQQELAELPGKERDLMLGRRVFRHPGEDGGPSKFGYLPE